MSLWWLQEGWTQARCGRCGSGIWPEGDPDWGLCLRCFDEEHQPEPEYPAAPLCDICEQHEACTDSNGYAVCSEDCHNEAIGRRRKTFPPFDLRLRYMPSMKPSITTPRRTDAMDPLDLANRLLVRRLQARMMHVGLYGAEVDAWGGPATSRAALGLLPSPTGVTEGEALDAATAAFPDVPRSYLGLRVPELLAALRDFRLADPTMVAMALASIRAESAGFRPIAERVSKYNTSPGGPPFGLYDHRSDLGHDAAGMGARYRGRGEGQLTGLYNYSRIGRLLSLPLAEEPELALDPRVSLLVLAAFLSLHEEEIRRALRRDDLRAARRLYNGGRHGLDRFAKAYRAAKRALGGVLMPCWRPTPTRTGGGGDE